jgi:tetratricopeptide (TPR) repeat protein
VLYERQGRHASAEPLFRRALAIDEKALGPDHRDVAKSAGLLARIYRNLGRYADAEPLFKRAFAIFEKTLGPDRPNVSISLNNRAELYRAQGRYADALPLVRTTIGNGRAAPSIALPVLFAAQGTGLMPSAKAQNDALNVVQHASQSAAAAVNKLAARLAAGTDRRQAWVVALAYRHKLTARSHLRSFFRAVDRAQIAYSNLKI